MSERLTSRNLPYEAYSILLIEVMPPLAILPGEATVQDDTIDNGSWQASCIETDVYDYCWQVCL